MKILLLHDNPCDFEEFLREDCSSHQLYWATGPEQVEALLPEVEPEVVFSIKHSAFPGEYHRPALHFPSVRWFQVGGSGYEHLGSWDPSKVQVSNCAGALAPFHAERAMAALLALSTGLPHLWEQQKERLWQATRFGTLQGKTLLIVGFGSTGQELALRAKAFGMKVIGVRRRPQAHPAADEVHPPEHLPELWERAQVLSLNTPLSEATRHLIDREVLRVLPQGCLLLNASRGDVVDQEALLEALLRGPLGGAWLDVCSPEPLPSESVLWSLPNVIITPHCADQVENFPLRYAQVFVRNLELYTQGRPLLHLLQAPEAVGISSNREFRRPQSKESRTEQDDQRSRQR